MIFKYEAMSSSGQEISAEIEAASSEDAIAKIRAKKLFPTKVKEKPEKSKRKGIDIGFDPSSLCSDEADDTKLGEELLDEILDKRRPKLIDHEEVERRLNEALDDRKKAKRAKKVPWIVLPKYGQAVLWFIFLIGILVGIVVGRIF